LKIELISLSNIYIARVLLPLSATLCRRSSYQYCVAMTSGRSW